MIIHAMLLRLYYSFGHPYKVVLATEGGGKIERLTNVVSIECDPPIVKSNDIIQEKTSESTPPFSKKPKTETLNTIDETNEVKGAIDTEEVQLKLQTESVHMETPSN